MSFGNHIRFYLEKMRKKIMTDEIKNLTNTIAKDFFGKTPDEAKETGLCIQCNEPAIPKCYSDAGRREYQITGLCEPCFDGLT